MKFKKYIILIIFIFIYAYLTVDVSESTDIINLYKGALFQTRINFILYEVIITICYCLFIHNEFESYVHEYGIYVITREKSRSKLLWRLIYKLLSFILIIESLKVISFSIIMILKKGKITVNNPIEVLKMISLTLMVYIIILFIQMMIELYLEGRTAIAIVLTYYIVNLGLGTVLYNFESKLNVLILPNYIMKYRLDVLIKEYNLNYTNILMILGLIIIIMVITAHKMFLKKDII